MVDSRKNVYGPLDDFLLLALIYICQYNLISFFFFHNKFRFAKNRQKVIKDNNIFQLLDGNKRSMAYLILLAH